MRKFGMSLLVVFPLALFAQPAEPDQPVLQKLLSEVQQLRVAIERSTLLGTRTQLTLSQLQLQERKMEQTSRELSDVRDSNTQIERQKERLAEALKDFEAKRLLASGPQAQLEVDGNIKQFKIELGDLVSAERRNSTKEDELASQIQAVQREIQDSRNWIAEMQRVLDAAIQQMLKPR